MIHTAQPMLEEMLRVTKIHVDNRLNGVPRAQMDQMIQSQMQPIFMYFEKGKTKLFPVYRNATPWSGFLNVRVGCPGILEICQSSMGIPPFVIVETDYPHYGGSPHNLVYVRKFFQGPIIVRDFYLSPAQIDEARACGADAMIFDLSLFPSINVHALYKHCKRLGMMPFYQVSNRADIQSVPENAKVVFVSCVDLREEKPKPSFQRALSIANEIGKDRCYIIDTPDSIDEISLESTRNELLGISYPDSMWSGDRVYAKIEALKNKRAQDFQDVLGLDAIETPEPWIMFVRMHGDPQPVQVMYNTRGEAEMARSQVREAWQAAASNMSMDGIPSGGKRDLLDILPGVNESSETIDPSDISRVIITPMRNVR